MTLKTALLIALMTGCTTETMTEPEEPPVELVGADIAVRDREPCWFYDWLLDRHWRAEVPYLAPAELGTEAVVSGRLEASRGSSVLCFDDRSDPDPKNPCPDMVGDTHVNDVLELHRSDGSVELGAFGHALLEQPNWQDNPAWCEWRAVVRVETP